MTRGMVGSVQPYSTEDGPGIRTTVFMMGCRLRCLWCANPEFLEQRVRTLQFPSEKKTVGSYMTVEELVSHLSRDRIFYEESGGGVTFSGGEAGLQKEFVERCADRLRKEGIHVCLDTSGFLPEADMRILSGKMDLILYDLKAFDSDLHHQLTGQTVETVLRNMRIVSESGTPWRLRLILVPGLNDQPEDLRRRMEFAASLPARPQAVDILLHHELGKGKYTALGLPVPPYRAMIPDAGLKDWIENTLRELGLTAGHFG